MTVQGETETTVYLSQLDLPVDLVKTEYPHLEVEFNVCLDWHGVQEDETPHFNGDSNCTVEIEYITIDEDEETEIEKDWLMRQPFYSQLLTYVEQKAWDTI